MQQAGSDIYFLIVTGFSILAVMVGFIIFFVVRYRTKQKANLAENTRLKSEYERQLLHTQLEIKEQTLKTISQEIHDNIGQMLSLAKLNLALVLQETPGLQRIEDSHQLVKKSIRDLRNLSHSMDTDYVAQMGLVRSLEYELEMISKTGVLKAALNCEGQKFEFDRQKELILFRIVQESLNNIIKHASASQVTITLNYMSDCLLLEVKDNGIGISIKSHQSEIETMNGAGVNNMRKRAALIGADFEISGLPAGGTIVAIKLPYQ